MKLKIVITTIGFACQLALAQAGSTDTELLKNGYFSAKGVRPWKIFSTNGTPTPKFKVVGGEVRITSAWKAIKPGHKQMTQSLKNVKSDTKYKLVFDAKAEDDKAKMH